MPLGKQEAGAYNNPGSFLCLSTLLISENQAHRKLVFREHATSEAQLPIIFRKVPILPLSCFTCCNDEYKFILLGALAELLGLAGQPSLYLGLYTLFAGVLVATVGLLILGGVIIATWALPGWVGALIILGSPLTVFVFAGLYDELQLLVGVAWALVGYKLFRQARVT